MRMKGKINIFFLFLKSYQILRRKNYDNIKYISIFIYYCDSLSQNSSFLCILWAKKVKLTPHPILYVITIKRRFFE